MTEQTQRLVEIVENAASCIEAVHEAARLIQSTYGAGCMDLGTHPDQDEIRKAVRLLSQQLCFLKARAAAQALMGETADKELAARLGVVR